MSQPQLFTPLTFPASGKQMRNRISLAPLTNMQSHDDGTLSDDEYNWLVRRAKENFGMVITCATNVSADGQWAGIVQNLKLSLKRQNSAKTIVFHRFNTFTPPHGVAPPYLKGELVHLQTELA